MRSLNVEISVFTNTVFVHCKLLFHYQGSEVGAAVHRAEIEESAQSYMKWVAENLCSRARAAFEDFREQYNGYDGGWQFKPGDIKGEFETES